MACSILILLVLSLLTYPPDSIPYVGPEEVALFSQGSGEYQVGLIPGDKPQGPARLLAVNSKLYLLDQLNSRVLCYDTSGSFLSEIKLDYKPLDMAVDGSDRVYVLTGCLNPSIVVAYDKGKESERLEVRNASLRPVNIVVYPEDIILILSGRRFYPLNPVLDLGGLLSCQQSQKKFYLKESKYFDRMGFGYTADYHDGFSTDLSEEIYRKSKQALPFLKDSNSIRIILGGKDTRSRKGLTTIERYLYVRANDVPTRLIDHLSVDYFFYNQDWRNVSVNDSGNIYIFASIPDSKAAILRWRPSL